MRTNHPQFSQFLLWVRQSDGGPCLLDEDKPSPVSAGQILAEVPLSNLDQLPLVELLLVDISADPLQHLTLDEAHPLDDQLVALLLKASKGTSTEEDKGVSEPVSLTVEGNSVHESVDSGLVVRRGLDGILTQARVPQFEVGVEHPVGESAHADPDSLEHTVAGQLVHDEWGLHLAGLLVGVGHKATHKVGLSGVEGGHQLNQGNEVDRGDSIAATLLLLLAVILGGGSWLTRMVFPQENQQGIGRLALHDFDHRVVDGVLVLLEPSSDVVGHDSGIVGDGEVGVLVSLGLGLQEDGKLTQGGLEFFLEGLVCRLGEQRLLLEDGPDTHRLLKHDDGGGQVHAEVNHHPVNSLAHVFLLLHNEHMVVEELLQLLVDEVDGDLLEAVVLKNFKSGNVKHSAEVGLLQGGINEGVVTFDDEPLEDTVVDTSGNTSNSVGGLLAGLTLGHPLGTDLDPGLAESLDHVEWIHTAESGGLTWVSVGTDLLALSLVVTALGLELHTTECHDGGSQHVAVVLLLLGEPENVEGVLGVLKLLIVVDRIDFSFALGHVDVVVNVSGELALAPQTTVADAITVLLDELVEDVVRSLHLLLLSDTGLLQQVGHDVATSQLTGGREMDTDELSETGRVVVPGGLGVTVGLQDGVGGHNLVLQRDLLLGLLARAGGDHGQVGDHLLGVLGLAGTGLSGDQHGVVLLVAQHVPVGPLSDGPEMRRDLITSLAKVDLADSVSVQRITLVRVDNNHEQTRVGVDKLGLVASLQVPEDGGVIEEGQVDHVLHLLELGRVDLAHLGSLEGELLVSHSDDTLAGGILQVSGLQDTLLVAVGLLIRDPHGLLGVVGFLLVSSLHLQRGQQELGGVGVHPPLHQLDMAGHVDSCDGLPTVACKELLA